MSSFLSPATLPNYNASKKAGALIVFDGSAAAGLAGTPFNVFIPNPAAGGLIIIRNIFFWSASSLTGGAGATLAAGVADNGAGSSSLAVFNAATLVSAFDGLKKIWAAGATAASVAQPAAQINYLMDNGRAIAIDPEVTNTTAGSMYVYVFYDPISTNASLVVQTSSAIQEV